MAGFSWSSRIHGFRMCLILVLRRTPLLLRHATLPVDTALSSNVAPPGAVRYLAEPTAASCTPVAPGTGCTRHERRSPARCRSHERSGESDQRSRPMSVGGSASCCSTTMRKPTRWRAPESCLRPRPVVGGTGGAEHREWRAPRWFASRAPAGRARWVKSGRPGSCAFSIPGNNDCGAESEHDAETDHGRSTSRLLSVSVPAAS